MNGSSGAVEAMSKYFDMLAYLMGKQAGGGGGSSTLSGLTDVDISNPTDGQTLVYNSTSGKWENGEVPGITEVIGEYSINPDTNTPEITVNMSPDSLYALCPSVSIKSQYPTLGGSVVEKKVSFVTASKETDDGDIFYDFLFSDNLVSGGPSGGETVVFTINM